MMHISESIPITNLASELKAPINPMVVGPHCWVIDSIIRFQQPIPAPGNQQIWRIAPEIFDRVISSISAHYLRPTGYVHQMTLYNQYLDRRHQYEDELRRYKEAITHTCSRGHQMGSPLM